MSSQTWIWIALGISITAFVGCIWQFANMQGYKGRGRRRTSTVSNNSQDNNNANSKRRSDKRKLSGQERKLYNEAQRLLAEGKIHPAARILEQLSMPREAIQTLEDAGLIHEAAKILMRMQRHNRAGVVYARHGLWDYAAQSFKLANMPLEVAKCYREIANHELAAEFFEKAGRIEEAAYSYEQCGQLHKAARLLGSLGLRERSMNLFSRLAASTDNISSLQLLEDELTEIVKYLGEGNTDSNLANVVMGSNKLVEVIINLISKGFIKQSSELFLRSTSDIGPQLMAEVNYQDRSAKVLAEMLLNVSSFQYAGMVFERMMAFDQAAEAFEKAEDFERASYCYERSGNGAKARQTREMANKLPRRTGNASPSIFSLSAVGTDMKALEDVPSVFGDNEGESTKVMVTEDANSIENEVDKEGQDKDGQDEEDEVDVEEQNSRNQVKASEIQSQATRATSEENLVFKNNVVDQKLSALPSPSTLPPPPALKTTLPDLPKIPVDSKGRFALSEESEKGNLVSPLPPTTKKLDSEIVTLDQGRSVFHKARFFEDLDFEQKNKLWTLGKTRAYSAEETILTYNDEPTGVYVILKGSVSCYRLVGGCEKYVDQMGESETFGELWLLADQPTAVRFVASKNTQLHLIEREAFNDLLDNDGNIARKVYKRFTMRLLKRLLRPQGVQKNLAS